MSETTVPTFAPDSTTIAWREELQRVLSGQREYHLRRLGSIQEYVEVLMAESEDPAAAQACFHEVLVDLVNSWQPSIGTRDEAQRYLLELIGAYAPQSGFPKVLSLASRLQDFSRQAGARAKRFMHLEIKALDILERYFPFPPVDMDHSPAFKVYLKLLRSYTDRDERHAYAVRRLVELGVLEVDSPEVAGLVPQSNAGLRELIRMAIDPEFHSESDKVLSALYEHCLEASAAAAQRFERALESVGASLTYGEGGARVVRLLTGGEVRLTIRRGFGGWLRDVWKDLNFADLKPELAAQAAEEQALSSEQ